MWRGFYKLLIERGKLKSISGGMEPVVIPEKVFNPIG
jgi:hypothetical protein